jgi:hypothetical protein
MAMAGIPSELRQIELWTGVTVACMFKQIGNGMGSQRVRSAISSSAPASVGAFQVGHSTQARFFP